jgi:hypothetical protein
VAQEVDEATDRGECIVHRDINRAAAGEQLDSVGKGEDQDHREPELGQRRDDERRRARHSVDGRATTGCLPRAERRPQHEAEQEGRSHQQQRVRQRVA